MSQKISKENFQNNKRRVEKNKENKDFGKTKRNIKKKEI